MKYLLLFEHFDTVDEAKIKVDRNQDYVTFYHGDDDIGQLELEFKPMIDWTDDDNNDIPESELKPKSVIIWGYEIYSIYRGKKLGILCIKKLIENLVTSFSSLKFIDLYVEMDNMVAIKTYKNIGFIAMPATHGNSYQKMRYYIYIK